MQESVAPVDFDEGAEWHDGVNATATAVTDGDLKWRLHGVLLVRFDLRPWLAQRQAQGCHTAVDMLGNRAGADAKRPRHLNLGQAGEVAQRHDLALVLRQRA